MPIALQLALRQYLHRPLRPVLCSLAIAAGVALILCVGAGFDSAKASLQQSIDQLLGTADIHVRPQLRGTNVRLSENVLDQVRATPGVAAASGRMDGQISLGAKSGSVRLVKCTAVDPSVDNALRPKLLVGGTALTGAPDEILLDDHTAGALPAAVGDTLTLSSSAGTEHTVRVVGVMRPSQIHVMIIPATVYLPLQSFLKYTGQTPEFNVIDVKLAPGLDDAAFAKTLGKDLGSGVMIDPAKSSHKDFEKHTAILRTALLGLSVITAICAALIIGTTLSVGVQERVRQFGQLRSIGASRTQLVQFLCADALLLMTVGTGIGLVLGYLLGRLMVWRFGEFFIVFALTPPSILTAIVNGLVATGAGSLIPAFQVSRITPMEAVQSTGRATSRRAVLLAGAIGLGAILLQLVLWFVIPNTSVRFWVYIAAGIPLVFVGYALLGPLLILFAERISARVIAPLVGLRPQLIQNAWSRTPWRAGGMIAALMIGVTMFTAVQTRAAILRNYAAFSTRFPDLFLFSKFDAIPQSVVDSLKQAVPGITEVSGVNAVWVWQQNARSLEYPKLRDEGTLFVAVDPPSFGRVMDLDFIEGKPAEAFAALAAGDHVFISKQYHDARHTGIGDQINLYFGDSTPHHFTVAAVVDSPGMNLAKDHFDVGGAFQDAALTSVVGSLNDLHRYGGPKGIRMLMIDLQQGSDPQRVLKQIRGQITDRPGQSIFGKLINVTKLGLDSASSVEMKRGLTETINRFVKVLSLIAVAAMALASLGVANMVIASVRARQYEFGILRAIGAGQGQLLRMILAESAFIAVIAALLGSLAGLHYALMSNLLDNLLWGFHPNFIMPWGALAVAFGITIALALLASLAPAVKAAVTAQRVLLAGGRG